MRRRIASWLLACLFAVMAAAYLPVAALADEMQMCSLTIDFHTGDTVSLPIPGAAFRIYRAAEKINGGYRWTAAFQDCGVSLETLDSWNNEELILLADTLAGYVAEAPDPPVADEAGVTDSDGKLAFEALEPGAYLVLGDPTAVDETVYIPAPFLVLLPAWSDGKPLNDVTAVPKYTHGEPAPTPTPMPTPTPVPNEPKLPQTGQTWWPVPVLFVVGMAVFAAGLLLVRQEEDSDAPKK